MKPLPLAFAGLFAITPRLAADDFDAAALYDKCVKSVVLVTVAEKDRAAVTGTGSLISVANRYVLTTNSVVGESERVFVQFLIRDKDGALVQEKKKYIERIPAGQAHQGKVVYRDKGRNLALVQLDKLPADARALPLARKSALVGEKVMSIGNPGKVESVFGTTTATVRAVADVELETGPADMRVRTKRKGVTTTNPTSVGSDPGELVIDPRGNQVGIYVNAFFDGGFQNVNKYLDVTEIRAFLEDKLGKEMAGDLEKEPPGTGGFDAGAVYDESVKSVAFLSVLDKDKGKARAIGSGSLIDTEKRYVLTNAHVVEDRDAVFVQFPVRGKDGTVLSDKRKYLERVEAGRALKGKVLFRDKTRDLALVQLDDMYADTPALPLAKESVRTGEKVIAIDNPEGVDWTFSTIQCTVRGVGVVDRVFGGGDEVPRIKVKMITLISVIGPSVGGLVIDRRGYQVGAMVRGAQSVNNAIDVTEIRAFLDANKVKVADPPPRKPLTRELLTDPKK